MNDKYWMFATPLMLFGKVTQLTRLKCNSLNLRSLSSLFWEANDSVCSSSAAAVALSFNGDQKSTVKPQPTEVNVF